LVWPFLFGLFSIMVFGLCFSLGEFNFFLAWLLTWILALLLPFLAIIELSFRYDFRASIAFGVPLAFQAAMGLLAWVLLERKIRLRTFVTRKDQKPAL